MVNVFAPATQQINVVWGISVSSVQSTTLVVLARVFVPPSLVDHKQLMATGLARGWIGGVRTVGVLEKENRV